MPCRVFFVLLAAASLQAGQGETALFNEDAQPSLPSLKTYTIHIGGGPPPAVHTSDDTQKVFIHVNPTKRLATANSNSAAASASAAVHASTDLKAMIRRLEAKVDALHRQHHGGQYKKLLAKAIGMIAKGTNKPSHDKHSQKMISRMRQKVKSLHKQIGQLQRSHSKASHSRIRLYNQISMFVHLVRDYMQRTAAPVSAAPTSLAPSAVPLSTALPTALPVVTQPPSQSPSLAPSLTPTAQPSFSPSATPTMVPSVPPSVIAAPMAAPVAVPMAAPVTATVAAPLTGAASSQSLPLAAPLATAALPPAPLSHDSDILHALKRLQKIVSALPPAKLASHSHTTSDSREIHVIFQ